MNGAPDINLNRCSIQFSSNLNNKVVHRLNLNFDSFVNCNLSQAHMRRNNSLLWLILVIVLIFILISVCRRPASKNQEKNQTVHVSSDDNNMLLGNPTNAIYSRSEPDNYLIDHKYYIESYNSITNTPNWISWHLQKSDLGSVDRLDDFRQDNNLPGGWYAVSPNNYKGSGFDKGHGCPSGDRTATQEANSSTFLMDNIIPQAPQNNQQTWEHLERYCRDKVKAGNEAYIVMGCYGTGGTGSRGYRKTIGYGKISVPARIWKVILLLPDGNNDLARMNGKTQLIAVDTPNDNKIATNWMNYVTTVNEIETNCHCDLLSALPATLQNELQSKKFSGGN